MGEEQEPADGAVRVGLWVVKEPRAKEHAWCLLGLGLTHSCGDFLHVLEARDSQWGRRVLVRRWTS